MPSSCIKSACVALQTPHLNMSSTDIDEQVDSSVSSSDERFDKRSNKSTEDVDTPYNSRELVTLVKVLPLVVILINFLTHPHFTET